MRPCGHWGKHKRNSFGFGFTIYEASDFLLIQAVWKTAMDKALTIIMLNFLNSCMTLEKEKALPDLLSWSLCFAFPFIILSLFSLNYGVLRIPITCYLYLGIAESDRWTVKDVFYPYQHRCPDLWVSLRLCVSIFVCNINHLSKK